jgi:hypothetical protein
MARVDRGVRTSIESFGRKRDTEKRVGELRQKRADRIHRMWYSKPYQAWMVGSYTRY